MQIYLDTADIEEIKKAQLMGLIDGVTTNPSLIAKSGRKREEVIEEICREVSGFVSAEVLATDAAGMIKEGRLLAKIAENVVVKVPMGAEALQAVRVFASEGIKTNVTLVFSPLQALMVAKAGATLVSPFVGRIDDLAANGMDLIDQITTIYQNYDFETKVLVASARHPLHLLESALLGADVVTVPFKVLCQVLEHPLTSKGLEQFLKDAGKL